MTAATTADFPLAHLLGDRLGPSGVTMSARDYGGGVEYHYEGHGRAVFLDYDGRGPLSGIMADGENPGLGDYTSVRFDPDETIDPGLATLLAGYLCDDRAAMIYGLTLVLRGRYRPDPRRGLVDLRTGAATDSPAAEYRDLLAFLDWFAVRARARIIAAFDDDGIPTSFGAVPVD